jgi:enterochelin esterase-like enzyme/predicted GH43/DUF377 family glycosyl hydrolase
VAILFVLPLSTLSYGEEDESTSLAGKTVFDYLKTLASKTGFKEYDGNPVITGDEGQWDAGALGSMSVLRVDDVFHVYYEAWGVRSEKEWDASEYESLQVGHATSKDGVHWTKDPQNPVLPQGAEGEWDATGVWDPYVIYEGGLYKMWYGGGGGREPNFGWAYAISKDGTHFEKKGLIGKGNLSGVEDCHVVRDTDSGLYYMYYWYGWHEPNALYCVTSPTETGFDFGKAVNVKIEGDDSFMCKFGHVLKDEDGWHMFYSNFVQPHCPNSTVRYATSEDGIHWQARNKRLIKGHDADVLRVADDLYLMVYSPQNHFDAKDCDIRLAVYNGRLPDLISKTAEVKVEDPTSLVGKTLTASLGDDEPHTLAFREDGEVVISEVGEEDEAFNAYYEQDGENVHILGEGLKLKGTYDGKTLKFGGEDESMSLVGKTLTTRVGEDEPTTWAFRENGAVTVSGGEAGEGLDAYYKQDGQKVYIEVAGFELEATYDGEKLEFKDEESTSREDESMSLETELVPSPARYSVLLPPGYVSGDGTYPLLFWLHGGSGHDGFLEGTARIFKRMWAEGALSELVVVIPHAARYPANYLDFQDGSQRWESFITRELLDHVRDKYRVSKDRSGTFIGGISMGGYGSLKMGLKHLDTFGAIVAFEPMIEPTFESEEGNPVDKAFWAANNPATIVRDNADAVRSSGIKIYIEVGSEDVFEFHRGTSFLHRVLYEREIRHEYRYVYGADHVGATLPGRYRDGLAFLNRVINPPPPDPAAENFRRLVR